MAAVLDTGIAVVPAARPIVEDPIPAAPGAPSVLSTDTTVAGAFASPLNTSDPAPNQPAVTPDPGATL